MKLIILSAFGGRLRSDPMEWPDERDYIFFPVAKSMASHRYDFGKEVTGAELTFKTAAFQRTDKHEILPNGRTAAIYELVEFPF